MKVHDLNILPVPFQALFEGRQRYVFRRAGRFEVGDQLRLREWDPPNSLTGRTFLVEVTHITRGSDYSVLEGFVVMSVDLGVSRSKIDALTKRMRALEEAGRNVLDTWHNTTEAQEKDAIDRLGDLIDGKRCRHILGLDPDNQPLRCNKRKCDDCDHLTSKSEEA